MGPILQFLFARILNPVLRPLLRLIVGFLAVPLFRLFLTKVTRVQQLDQELDKDLEEWFKASLVLLVATKNIEMAFFPGLEASTFSEPIMLGFRLMMIVGVIELMPDQQLFSLIYPGPPKIRFTRSMKLWKTIKEQWKPYLKGLLCRYMSQSTPVFAILAGIFPGTTGWICFGMAITQYLIIGLVTSRDKAHALLSEFDRQIAQKREELVNQFQIEEKVLISSLQNSLCEEQSRLQTSKSVLKFDTMTQDDSPSSSEDLRNCG